VRLGSVSIKAVRKMLVKLIPYRTKDLSFTYDNIFIFSGYYKIMVAVGYTTRNFEGIEIVDIETSIPKKCASVPNFPISVR